MEFMSIQHCRRLFGHYGTFATLRLHTAVACHDEYMSSGFDNLFRRSGKDHENNPGLRRFMKTLNYVDAEHFSTDEIRFLIQIATSYKNLTDEQIDDEIEQIKGDAQSAPILKRHAEYLLKAVDYWKMHFREKFEEWRREYIEADQGWIRRRMLRRNVAQLNTGINVTDDGYWSGNESDEDEWMLFDREIDVD